MKKCKDCKISAREIEVNWSDRYKCWLCESCYLKRLFKDGKKIIEVVQ